MVCKKVSNIKILEVPGYLWHENLMSIIIVLMDSVDGVKLALNRCFLEMQNLNKSLDGKSVYWSNVKGRILVPRANE